MNDCRYQDDTYYEAIVESDMTDIDSPEELDGWNEEEEVLECTRQSDDGDFCLFHSEINLENRDKFGEELKSELQRETDEPLRIIEGNMNTITLDENDINRPIWLFGSKFNNRFEINDINIENPCLIYDSEFLDIVEFSNTEFKKSISFTECEFEDKTKFTVSQFNGKSDFESSCFNDELIMDRVTFRSDANFSFAKFNEETRIGSCIFESNASFYRARFNGETKIARVRDIDTIDPAVDSMTKFEGTADFSNARFSNGSKIYIKLESKGDFHKADIDNCDFRGVDLSECNLENSNLSGSILYDADLRGCKLMGAELDGARLNNKTKFLGDPEHDDVDGYDHSITSIIRNKRCRYDPKYKHAECEEDKDDEQLRSEARIVYRELQELAKSSSHSQLQTRAFVHRKDMEKDRYWNDIWSFDSGPTQPLVASARWLRAKLSRVIMLYGESPWRVLAWSSTLVFGFAVAYIWFGLIEGSNGVIKVTLDQLISDPASVASTLAGSIYYSALIFTNLSFGRYSPVGFGTYLTAIETTVGLTMLALFFFVLGRRASK